ncbi:MAG: co-chaperone GroES [Treponema sp.]|nr:co-chaperone GroES [Treponema sp.]
MFCKRRTDKKVKPWADRVMVKLEKNEAKTAGGIIIPDTAQEKTQQGVVVEIGDDKDVIKVKAGQKVMYDKYAGTQIKIDGVEHLILKMSDIIAVVE